MAVIPSWGDSNAFVQLYGTGSVYNNLPNANEIMQNIEADSRELWAREDSAHQREVEDLKKAGLNPWLSSTSGGSGLSAGSNLPSLDSLSGLIQSLGLVLDSTRVDNQTRNSVTNVMNAVCNGLKTIMTPFSW